MLGMDSVVPLSVLKPSQQPSFMPDSDTGGQVHPRRAATGEGMAEEEGVAMDPALMPATAIEEDADALRNLPLDTGKGASSG